MNIITTAAHAAHQADAHAQPRLDAEFLASQVIENERFTKHGITRDDLHVLFEMDWCSQSGGACNQRFGRALNPLVALTAVLTMTMPPDTPEPTDSGLYPAGWTITPQAPTKPHRRGVTRQCSLTGFLCS